MLTYINSDAFVSEHIEHISTCDFNVLFTTRLNVSTFTKQTRPPFGSHVYCVYKYTTTEVCFIVLIQLIVRYLVPMKK